MYFQHISSRSPAWDHVFFFSLPVFQLKSQAFLMSRRDLSSLLFLLTHNAVYVHWDESSLPSGNLVKGTEKWMALLMNQLLMAASDSQYAAFWQETQMLLGHELFHADIKQMANKKKLFSLIENVWWWRRWSCVSVKKMRWEVEQDWKQSISRKNTMSWRWQAPFEKSIDFYFVPSLTSTPESEQSDQTRQTSRPDFPQHDSAKKPCNLAAFRKAIVPLAYGNTSPASLHVHCFHFHLNKIPIQCPAVARRRITCILQ